MLKTSLAACVCLVVWLASASPALAEVSARRIITLSPHATELVYAAGAGDQIVATVQASDYPQSARALPRIGDGLLPDPERLLRFKPDLLIGWQSSQFSTLSSLNIPTLLSNPKTLEDVPDTIETLGRMLGTAEVAQARAAVLRNTLSRITARTTPGEPVRVFLQVGDPPEHSLNRSHLLSQIVEACGGQNIFGPAVAVAPPISAEGVLSQRPDVVLLGRAGAPAQPTPDAKARDDWLRLNLPAAKARQVFVMDSDVIYRPGPRLIEAADSICSMIQQARK